MHSVEKCLRELGGAADKLGVVGNLKSVVFHELSQEELQLCSFHLFSPNSPLSLLLYLERCIRHQLEHPLAKEREALFHFIDEFLLLMGHRVADYAPDILDVCWATYRKEFKSNLLRVAALSPILTIVNLDFPLLDAARLRIREMSRVFYDNLVVGSRPPATLRGLLLRLLGSFAERHPGALVELVRQLIPLFMETLAEEVVSNKPDFPVIAASLDGLAGVLVNSRGDFTAQPQNIGLVYNYVMRALVPMEGQTRYELPRAGLRLIAKHADLFAEYLTEDCRKVYDVLVSSPKALCRHNNKEMRSLAHKALDAFFAQVCAQLISGKRDRERDAQDFGFFVKKFFDLIQSELDLRSDISIAISGFGAFAPAIAVFLGQEELTGVVHKLFQLCERVINGQRLNEAQDRAQIHLGSFLSTFAQLILQMDELDEVYLSKLGQLVGRLFGIYPLMFPKQRKSLTHAVSILFIALYSKGSCLRHMMSEVTRSCLLVTCSDPKSLFDRRSMDDNQEGGNDQDGVQEDSNNNNNNNNNNKGMAAASDGTARQLSSAETRRFDVTAVPGKPWLTYLPLWRVMLKPTVTRDVDFPESFVDEVSAVVFDELMRAIMSLLSSLNLTSVPAEMMASEGADAGRAAAASSASSEEHLVSETMVMRYPRDHEILHNLVSFCEDLLQYHHQDLFCRRWVFLFGEQLIQASAEFPLVANFYRLIAVVFRICEHQRYFKGLQLDSTAVLSNVAETLRAHAIASGELVAASGLGSATTATTREVTFLLFNKCVQEIISRSQQFKDELLSAAVGLILAVPREFLNVSLMLPSLEMAFRMGLSYEPLAILGLDALEHWLHVAPEKVIPRLQLILPMLGDYLTSETKGGPAISSSGAPPSLEPSSSLSSSALFTEGRTKLVYKKSGGRRGKVQITRKTVALDIQYRILGLLGMVGGHNEAILSGVNFDVDHSMAWDSVKRIKFNLPFPDLFPAIYFDELLPRIIFLAESAPDRRSKVSACELLHSLVLYMIGKNSSDPTRNEGGDKTAANFSKLYEHVFPAMLRLATDVDLVAKQLFYTLTFQCICWFTHGTPQLESSETGILLDAIVEAVGDENSSALRQFGARCIGEFFHWAIQRSQSLPLEQVFKGLLKRIYSLAHQPSPFARLGAAAAFGQIYREFREHQVLVKTHVLDMLFEILQSLRVAHNDPEAVGTADKASLVVRQLAYIVKKYGVRLMGQVGTESSRFRSLKSFVEFLTGEVSAPETRYRKECTALLADLVPLLPESQGSVEKWFSSKGPDFVVKIAERHLSKYVNSASVDNLSSADGYASVLSFFASLTASVECIGWLLRHSYVLGPIQAFASEETCVFPGMVRLMVEFGQSVSAVPSLRSLTPFEQSQYRLLNASALLRSYRFLVLLAEKFPTWFKTSPLIRKVLQADKFFSRLLESILDPTTASGGDAVLFKGFTVYPVVLIGHLDVPHGLLKSFLAMPQFNLFLLDPSSPTANLASASILVSCYRRILQHTAKDLAPGAKDFVMNKSMKLCAGGLNPAQSLLANEIMGLCLEVDGLSPKDVINLLLINDAVAREAAPGAAAAPGDSQAYVRAVPAVHLSRSTLGSMWYDTFREPVDRFLLSKWALVGDVVLAQMQHSPVMLSVLFSLLKKCGTKPRNSHAASKAPKQMCKYGALCYRLSAHHRSKYYHASETGNDSEDASLVARGNEQAMELQGGPEEHWTEEFKAAFLNQVCANLEQLAGWVRDEADPRAREKLMELLQELIRLDPHQVLKPKSASREFSIVVASRFLAKTVPLGLKNRAMAFMGPILRLPNSEIGPVLEGIRSVTVYDFPVRSADLVPGSPLYNEYLQAIDTILALLRESGNLRLLELLYPVLRDERHVHLAEIHRGLAMFVESLDIDRCLEAFRMCYQALLDPLHPYMLQYILLTKICVPILSKLHNDGAVDVLMDLFEEYVTLLVDNVPQEANVTAPRKFASADPSPAKRHASAEPGIAMIEHNLVVQICTFDLLREFYTLISDKSLLHGRINDKYLRDVDPNKRKITGTELTVRISSSAYSAKTAQLVLSPEIPGMLVRNYHQSAYNCLAAVVVRTQTKEEMFSGLLLEEKTKKTNTCWWTNIIPTEEVFRFPVSTNFAVIRKDIREVRTENDLFLETAFHRGSDGVDRREVSKHFISGSSLDLESDYAGDFWASGGRGSASQSESHAAALNSFAPIVADSFDEADRNVRATSTPPEPGKTVKQVKKVEAYEFDVINRIPCMPTVLHVIDTMLERFPRGHDRQMPGWMANLVKVLDNDSLHPNVRLFVGKIIILRPNAFKPYAVSLYGPLLRLCTSVLNFQDGFSYYLRDICVTFLTAFRAEKPEAELRPLLSSFAALLIKCIPHGNRTIVRENIRLVQLLYDLWGRQFPIDKRLVMALLKQSHNGEVSATARTIGLQLVSMIITVGKEPPHVPEDSGIVTEEDFYRTLLSCLEFNSSRVYIHGAEVAGQVVHMLASKRHHSHRAVCDALSKKITFMYEKKQYDRMVLCLQQICANAPQLCDEHIGRIFNILATLAGDFKLVALDVIAQRAGEIENLPQLIRSHLVSLLENREARTQLLALKILLPLVPTLDEQMLSNCLRPLSEFPKNISVECRRVAYEIFRKIWDMRPEFHANRALRVALLQGLVDPEEKKHLLEEFRYTEEERAEVEAHRPISEVMLEFWNDPRRLSDSTLARLEELLSTAYEPDVEGEWLSFAPSLLLVLCSKNKQSHEKLFDYQLDNGAQFVAVEIDTRTVLGSTAGGRDRSLPFSPTFSATAGTGAGGGTHSAVAGTQDEYLSLDAFTSYRSLPSVKFTQTGMATAGGNQLSFAEFAGSLSADPALYSRKDLVRGMWKKPELVGQKAAAVSLDDGSKPTSSQIISGSTGVEGESDSVEVYTRFQPPREGMSSAFDIVAHQKKRQKYALLSRYQASQQSAKLSLSRKYEMGVLPNIGITPEEFIAPLRILAMRDKALSSALLAVMIEGMIQAVPQGSRPHLQESLQHLLSDCLGKSVYNGAFVSCLLRVCAQQDGIMINDALVGTVALRSFSYHGGAMLLEKQIVARKDAMGVPDPGERKRRRKDERADHLKNVDSSADHAGWKPLASLYKELGDEDVLMGIYDKHLAQHSFTHDAIHKELQGDYESALQIYELGSAAASDPNYDWNMNAPLKDELDLWEDGRLECLANLIRWNDLVGAAKAEVDGDPAGLWVAAGAEEVDDMSLYRELYVRGSYRCHEQWSELFQFTDASLLEEGKASWLRTHFGPEMAMLAIVRDDFPRASALCSQAMGSILSSWRSLHPLARNGRLKLLQRLQLIREMQEVLDFVKQDRNFESIHPLERLLEKWEKRWPLEQTSIVAWDSVAYGRELLLNKLKDRFVSRERVGAHQQHFGVQAPLDFTPRSKVESLIAEANVANWRHCTRAAMRQHNLAVATQFQTFCLQAENIRASVSDTMAKVDVPSTCILVKLYARKSQAAKTPEDQVRILAKAIDYFETRPGLSEAVLQAQPRHYIIYHRLAAKLYLQLHELLHTTRVADAGRVVSLVELAQSKQVLPLVDGSQYVRECLKKSYGLLQKAYKAGHQHAEQDPTLVAKTYIRMAQFCDAMLTGPGAAERTAASRASYAKHVIEPVLEAVALNSREASDLLPRVVVLLSENRADAKVEGAFLKGMEACPSWMFIRWISYLLSTLSDAWMAERVLPSLAKMAKDYPVAMYFPFNLSADRKFLPEESQRIIEPLRKILKAPILEKFMFHLMLLQHPEHRLADWRDEVRRIRKKFKGDPSSSRQAQEALAADWKRFYDLTLDSTNSLYGAYNLKFANSYSSKLVKAVGGEEGRSLSKPVFSEASVNDLVVKAKEHIPHKNSTRKEELSLYSRWLTDYDLGQLAPEERLFMEVPGQYQGYMGKPDPETHVRISSFADQILSMGSIRKPKKLTMIGTNQKMYPWLVKGGEDVRQDQRIEELWSLMNDVLQGNTSTSSRGLLLQTYQVVPMSPQLGLIEWREGTRSLKQLIEDEIRPLTIGALPGYREHSLWIDKFASAGRNDNQTMYHTMVQDATRANAISKWERQQQVTDGFLLKKAIHAIACSPESYLCLRNGFARSLAVMSVAGFVAGIGDRHLDNILVDVRKGFVVGIDFGHAFGSATFQLPIAELIPFRLTPQLVNFLNPLGPEGLLLHNMTHVMTCFVEHKQRLLSLMEIFLNEPHMDWVKQSEKYAALGMEGGAVSMFAQKRIKIVRDKLSLRNPAYITVEELEESAIMRTRPTVVRKYQELAKGSPKHNVRARCGEYCSSIAEQVECLVDQATDANILARAWGGWQSFC